jgi:hypothetical protein
MSEPEPDPLEQLSSEKLHDLAVHYALRHLDVKFFWDLLKILPAAEVAAGEPEEADMDVFTLRGHIDDITDSGRGEIAEGLRWFYLEYLRKHDITP